MKIDLPQVPRREVARETAYVMLSIVLVVLLLVPWVIIHTVTWISDTWIRHHGGLD